MNKYLFYFASVVFSFFLSLFPVLTQGKQPLDTAKIKEKTRDINPFNPDQYHYVSWQDNMMGASPETAKMTKYADTPVSNAYGQAEIGIPIYTVQSRSLKLPIALSYDSSGIKPEEISGIVGLGWNLQAGGVITRTIIGRVDTGDEIPPEARILPTRRGWSTTPIPMTIRNTTVTVITSAVIPARFTRFPTVALCRQSLRN